MSRFEVLPAALRTTAAGLRRSLRVAEQVAEDRGSLTVHLADAGSPVLADAGREFLDRWAHGCSLIVRDGEALATMLEGASSCYLDVETAAAGAFEVRP